MIDVIEIARYVRMINGDKTKSKEVAYNEVITYLSEQLAFAESREDISFLHHRIAEQHAFYGYVDKEEGAWSEVMRLFPDDPLSWTGASGFYLCTKPDPSRAIDLAKMGMQVAEKCGRFVIYSGGALCRAARNAGDYGLMEAAIVRILNHKPGNKAMDSSYECDFLAGLPDGAVSEILIRKLRSMCKS